MPERKYFPRKSTNLDVDVHGIDFNVDRKFLVNVIVQCFVRIFFVSNFVGDLLITECKSRSNVMFMQH